MPGLHLLTIADMIAMPEDERKIIDSVAETGTLGILGFTDSMGQNSDTLDISMAISKALHRKINEDRGCPVPVRSLVSASIAQKLVRPS